LKKGKNKNPCEIRKGDIVTRKSYGHDIIFVVKKVIKADDIAIAILKGCILRIEASAPITDLVKVNKKEFQRAMSHLDYRIENRIGEVKIKNDNRKITFEQNEFIYTGKILHLDGDNSFVYTSQNGLNTGL